MGMARLVVTAVLVEGRSKSEVARTYGVSRRWVITLVARFLAEGEAGLAPRSRRPRSSPNRTTRAVEDEIVELRKDLDRDGHDAGAATIAYHLAAPRARLRGPGGLDDLADPDRPRVPHPATPQTPEVQLHPVRRRPAQRTLATRHHPLVTRRRPRRRDPQRARRPLPTLPTQRCTHGVQVRRRGRHVPGRRSSVR